MRTTKRLRVANLNQAIKNQSAQQNSTAFSAAPETVYDIKKISVKMDQDSDFEARRLFNYRKRQMPDSPVSDEAEEKIPRMEMEPKIFIIPSNDNPLIAEKLAVVESKRGDIPAILYAAEFACFEVCEEFVERGANVNVRDKNGNDVYHYASKMKQFNVNREDAVMVALQLGNFKFAYKLFDLYNSDKSFLSHCVLNSVPLDLLKFAYEQEPSVVKVEERDVYLYDKRIPRDAAMCQDFETFTWILEMASGLVGDLFNCKEWRLEIVKHAALNYDKCAGEAIANHVFSSFANDYEKEDLTRVLTEVMPKGNLKVVKMLIDGGADLNSRLVKGGISYSLFESALVMDEFEAAKFTYGRNQEEITPRMLESAALNGNVEMCEWLVGLLEAQVPYFIRHILLLNIQVTVKMENSENADTKESNDRKQPVDQSPESNEIKEIPRVEFDSKVPLAEKLVYVDSNRGDIPAILYAAEFACFEVCQKLVEQGANVNVRDENGNDVYHYACKNETCDLELIDLFANNKAEMKRFNENRADAVMIAIHRGNVKFAVKLFDLYGTELSFLWYCIPSQTTNMLKLAYNQDPSVGKVKDSDEFDKEILKQAAFFKDFETFEWVLDIEKDFSGNSLRSKEFRLDILKKAAFNDNEEASEEIANFIFSFASDFEREDLTRLLTDIMPRGNLKVVKILVDRGADMKLRMWREGISYSLFEDAVEKDELEAAKFAYEQNPEEEITSRMLNSAAETGNVEMCEWLVGLLEAPFIEILVPAFICFIASYKPFGDDIIPHCATKLRSYINQVDREGKTALHLAVDDHSLVALDALLKIGADMKVKYRFYNLLIYCLKNKFLEGAKILYAKDRSQLRGCYAKMASAFSTDHEETKKWLNSLPKRKSKPNDNLDDIYKVINALSGPFFELYGIEN
ncbi:Hypothetical predicted protein [Cloeon dipterum]|uniref:Uncharacterized protein n=1 Tax=Cloeon dipterum TaxID=197152 RepID=A0A8S1E5E8_9INSE|nr:Hypothetical predicted protein [Cloeon dipterum]